MKFDRLYFCTAGVPLSSKPGIINGLYRLKELGLDGMEIEFVRGVRMSDDLAKEVNHVAKKLGLKLTAHAPYYINLNSKESEKVEASIKRILDTAYKLYLCGGHSITFHAAYYMKESKEKTYEIVKFALTKIVSKLKDNNIKVQIRPELTGKPTQFGDLDELIKLSKEIDLVLPCIDFAHKHARENGKFNTYEEFVEMFETIKNELGEDVLHDMHMHVSGINYSEKGEKNHLTLKESDFNYKDLLKAMKKFDIQGVLINESPNIEEDAMLLKKEYSRLK
ncbi:MAG: deoxyribonuclease [Candidatus Woesearchaeota archaeon]|nr:deoxyribonuclease [Candidatus Woesearchaeota archaeon]